MFAADIGDGGWLTCSFLAGVCAGAALATRIARRRGHVRLSIEVGDPPDRPRTPRDPS